jgi:hypothetical protein
MLVHLVSPPLTHVAHLLRGGISSEDPWEVPTPADQRSRATRADRVGGLR